MHELYCPKLLSGTTSSGAFWVVLTPHLPGRISEGTKKFIFEVNLNPLKCVELCTAVSPTQNIILHLLSRPQFWKKKEKRIRLK